MNPKICSLPVGDKCPRHSSGLISKLHCMKATDQSLSNDSTRRVCVCVSIPCAPQIKKEYGTNVVPSFPPKKIFTLTPAEVEQRREQLEKYMQAGKLPMQRITFSENYTHPHPVTHGLILSVPEVGWSC